MKTILLWDPRFPDRRPARLTVEDTVASAAVRAGVAAAANPADAGALSAGATLDPTMLTEVVLQHGNGGATRRVFLPYSVVMVGALAGVLAAIGTPIAAGVTPTPSPTIAFANTTASLTEGDSGTKTVSNVINVTRNGVTGPLTVNLTYGGTATSGTDYVAGLVSGTIADGQSTLSFDLTVNGDTGVESDETIVINAVLAAYSSATASKTITITNDDVTSGTAPTITGTPNAAVVGRSYSFQPATTGTGNSYALDSSSDPLPSGVALSSTTGAITGPRTAPGEAKNIRIKATNASGSAVLTCTLPAVPRLMFAASGNRIGKTRYTIPAGVDRIEGQAGQWIGKDSDLLELRVAATGWAIVEDDTAPEGVGVGNYQFLELVAVYNGVEATVLSTLRNAAEALTVTPADAYVASPAVLPSAFGVSKFAKGSIIRWRWKLGVTPGNTIARSMIIGSAVNGCNVPFSGEQYTYDSTQGTNASRTMTGGTAALSVPTNGTKVSGSDANFAYGLAFTLGEFETPKRHGNSTLIEGDSINDNGMGMRALGWLTQPTVRPGLQLSVFGFKPSQAVTNDTRRMALRALCDTGYTNLGTNGLSSALTFSQVSASLKSLYAKWRSVGVTRVIQSLIQQRVSMVPVTSASVSGTVLTLKVGSTSGLVNGARYRVTGSIAAELRTTATTATAMTVVDATTVQFTYPTAPSVQGSTTVAATFISDEYRSKGCQRVTVGQETGGTRDQLNAYFLAPDADGPDFAPDTVTPVADPTDNHYWRSDGTGGVDSGTATPLTDDGTHQNTTGEALVAPAITAAVDAA